MNRLILLFKNWLETSTQKQKLTAALLVFSILSTMGLMVMKTASASTADPLESGPLYFVSVFAKLIVVLLLIFVCSVTFRRWLQPGFSGKKTRQLQLLETMRLSPKQALHLIAVGDQQLLVGATDQGISLVTRVEPSLDLTSTEPVAQPRTDFSSVLQAFNLPDRSDKIS